MQVICSGSHNALIFHFQPLVYCGWSSGYGQASVMCEVEEGAQVGFGVHYQSEQSAKITKDLVWGNAMQLRPFYGELAEEGQCLAIVITSVGCIASNGAPKHRRRIRLGGCYLHTTPACESLHYVKLHL